MHRLLQYIWSRVQETHQHKYPSLPPSFDQLHRTSQSPPTGNNYSAILANIQQQLEKRIINVEKIKSIGQGLYDKLSQDISVLHGNHQILSNMQNIEKAVQQCESRFRGMVDELVEKYRLVMAEGGLTEGFEVFVNKYYQHYCTSVDKEIVSIYRDILHESSLIKIPTGYQQMQQPHQFYPYSQNFPPLVELLTRFRSVLDSEYQTLLSTRSNKQQQCRAAVLFLSKLRTLFIEMKDALWDTNCTLNSMYWYAHHQKIRIRNRLQASYRKYIRASNTSKRKSNLFMLEDVVESEYIEEDHNSQKEYDEDSDAARRRKYFKTKIPSYVPSKQLLAIGFHYDCHSEILQYLYLKFIAHRQLASLHQGIVRSKQLILTNILAKSTSNQLQVTIKQTHNKIKYLISLANMGCYVYFEEIQKLAEQHVGKLDQARRDWESLQIFVGRFGLICGSLVARVKLIGGMQKNLQYKQCMKICIELSEIGDKLKQVINSMDKTPALDNNELKHTLTSQILACQQLRLLFYKSHKSQQAHNKPEEMRKKIQSSSVTQHILIEEHPEQEIEEGPYSVEEEVNKMMEYADKCSEFFQFQFKGMVGSGYELIVFHLEKSSNSKANQAKMVKLLNHMNGLMKMSQTHTCLLSQKYKQQNNLNLSQIRKQCGAATLNIKTMQILISMSYTSASGKSIMEVYEQCINFQYQDWQKKIRQFESQLKVFQGKCKQVYQLQQNNTTSLFSIVYRTLKQYISILQIICDIFEEALFIFSNCKQLELSRKGNIHNKSINLLSEQDLNYLTQILAYKVKMNEQISQLDKFSNIPKIARTYLKAIYIKFRNNYNNYLPFQEDLLNNLVKRMQSAIGFAASHAQIFRIYQATVKKVVSNTNKKEMDELWEMSKEIIQLEKENLEIQKLSYIRISIDGRSIQQLRKIFKSHADQIKFAQLVNDLYESHGKSKIYAIEVDSKNQVKYNTLIQALKNYYR